jgi:hypothetical protein
MLRRNKQKRVVDMTNEEAAMFYVRRAASAQQLGNFARANHLFHTAALHDPNNIDARVGIERTGPLCEQQQKMNAAALARAADTQPTPRHRHRHRHRPWWKKALHSVRIGT